MAKKKRFAGPKKPAPETPVEWVSVQELVLDNKNPRFATPAGQSELFARYAANPKVQRLAKHVLDNGVDPLSALGVNKLTVGRYVSREGNRRTAALRLLDQPNLAGNERLTKRFQDLVAAGTYQPPKRIRCAIFAKAEDANEWMRVKHGGEQDGVGTENWSPLQTSRFNTRTGGDSQYAIAQQLIDQAIDAGLISETDAEQVATSSLARVLNDVAVQGILHASTEESGVAFALDSPSQERLTRRLLNDWSKGGKSVRDIDGAGQRRAYAEELVTELDLKATPTSKRRGAAATAAASAGAASSKRPTGPRRVLMPPKFQLNPKHATPRVQRIAAELRKLDLEKFPNAIAMLFRLFFEASVDQYLNRHHAQPARDKFGNLAKLSARVEAAIAHLRQKHPDNKQALRAPKAAMSDPLFALANLHEYVHNPTWQPLPNHLRTHWDNYSEFMRLLWE